MTELMVKVRRSWDAKWKDEGQRMAWELLRGFVVFLRSKGDYTKYPVPVDRIIEEYLQLDFEIVPLQSVFPNLACDKNDKLLGCLAPNRDRTGWVIYLDQHLEEKRSKGVVEFTLAHELIHYMGDLTEDERNNPHLSAEGADPKMVIPRIVCRRKEKRTRMEARANFGAACLLAPGTSVIIEYDKWLEHKKLTRIRALEDKRLQIKAIGDIADVFGMSYPAMAIRFSEIEIFSTEDLSDLYYEDEF